VEGDRVLMVAGAAARTESVAMVDAGAGTCSVLRESAPREFDESYVSTPEAIEFATGDGELAHAFYYPPRNPDYRAPDDERPPLIVIGHGGPTASTSATLNLRLQFWTSRGFALLDVNYRGSTGYGRAYRESLAGRWGIADVEDCINGARHLAGTRRADGSRLVIRGGSAGGYTTLAALAFHDVFAAGASYYGVSDLETLAKDTHKFESRYLDRLIGPYPEERDRYLARSPIHAVERLSCPVIFFQGLEDEVVPPSQAERMVEALRAKGIAVAYLAFEGEQHGFRKAETIERTLQSELCFYARVFGFEPADDLPELTIDNL
jgi:dipeptidyl aminopeptidase/acylaminoacyl peptidase